MIAERKRTPLRACHGRASSALARPARRASGGGAGRGSRAHRRRRSPVQARHTRCGAAANLHNESARAGEGWAGVSACAARVSSCANERMSASMVAGQGAGSIGVRGGRSSLPPTRGAACGSEGHTEGPGGPEGAGPGDFWGRAVAHHHWRAPERAPAPPGGSTRPSACFDCTAPLPSKPKMQQGEGVSARLWACVEGGRV